MDVMIAALIPILFVFIPSIILVILGIYATVLLIKALKIYIRKNS